MSINVCMSTTDGWLSRTIRWMTRSAASHSMITFRDETLGKVFVMEANGRGFMLVPWASWSKHNTLVARYSLKTSEGQQLKSLQLLADKLGSQYDYVSLFGFLLRRFMKRMQNPLSNSKKLVCSEAVAEFLYRTDDPALAKFKECDTWVPEDILAEAKMSDVFVLEESDGSDDQGPHQEHRRI